MDNPGVRFPPPLIFALGLAAGIVLDAALGSEPPGVWRAVGVAAIVAGVALQSVFLRAFRRARTSIEPWKPASALVTDGIYARTRNPAYIGGALIAAGIALAIDAPWAILPIPLVLVVIDRYVIAREERYLARHFGAEYDEYRSRVRRWV